MFAECGVKVFSVALSDIFNAEVINDEYEEDWTPFVPPEAGCGRTLEVSMPFKSLGEEIISQFAGLFEAVDAFCDFEVHPPFMNVFCEVIFVDDLLWNDRELNADVFRMVKWTAEVEVFYVECGILGGTIRYYSCFL